MSVEWQLAAWFGFPQQVLGILCGHVGHQGRSAFENCVAKPSQNITVIQPGSRWSMLLTRNVMQEAMTVLFTLYPEERERAYVDDIKLHLAGKINDVVEIAKNVFGMLKEQLQEVKLIVSLTENGKKERG